MVWLSMLVVLNSSVEDVMNMIVFFEINVDDLNDWYYNYDWEKIIYKSCLNVFYELFV